MESQTSSDGAATQPVATETSPDGEGFEEIMHTAKKQNKRLKEASGSMERSLDAIQREIRRLKEEMAGLREEVQTQVQSEEFMLPCHF